MTKEMTKENVEWLKKMFVDERLFDIFIYNVYISYTMH